MRQPPRSTFFPYATLFRSNVTPEQLVAAGERVFNGIGGCTTCHGLGTRAPNLLTDEQGTGPIGARCGKREPGKRDRKSTRLNSSHPAISYAGFCLITKT